MDEKIKNMLRDKKLEPVEGHIYAYRYDNGDVKYATYESMKFRETVDSDW